MDKTELAVAVVMLGSNVRERHAQIRDHLENSTVVKGWLEKAEEQLDQLMEMANQVLKESTETENPTSIGG